MKRRAKIHFEARKKFFMRACYAFTCFKTLLSFIQIALKLHSFITKTASVGNQIMSFVVQLSLAVGTTLLNNLLPALNYVYFFRHSSCHDGFSLSLTFTLLLLRVGILQRSLIFF